VDWDYINNPGVTTSTATGSATTLSINLNNTYAIVQDANQYDIKITVTNDLGDSIDYVADVLLYQEVTLDDFALNFGGWQEDLHIRELVDVNDDGFLDIVGFGGGGVLVSLWDDAANIFSASTTWLTGNYGAAASGGSYSKTEHPRFIIDFDDDGLKDVVAFAAGGVVWCKNNGSGFDAASTIVSQFGSSNGWDSTKHIRQLADVDGNGTPDVVAFGADDVLTFLSSGVNNSIITANNNFAYNDGWRKNLHYRLLADVDNDGRADILAFSNTTMSAALGLSDGTFANAVAFKSGAQAIGNGNGWLPTSHPVYIEDVNDDGKRDIIAIGAGGVVVFINESTVSSVAFADAVFWIGDYHVNAGWNVTANRNPRFIADTNNDGYKDITGFGNAAVLSSLNGLSQGENAFANQTEISNSFDTSANWISGGLYNSRYVRDINNDGRADILGFGNNGVVTQRMPVITQPTEQ